VDQRVYAVLETIADWRRAAKRRQGTRSHAIEGDAPCPGSGAEGRISDLADLEDATRVQVHTWLAGQFDGCPGRAVA
jgi:hypothetical protein